MALSASDLAWIRGKVGSTPSDSDLSARYARLGSRADVAREVLQERLANFTSEPATLNVEGELSQSTAENIRALREQLQDPDLYDTDDESPRDVEFVRPAPRPRR